MSALQYEDPQTGSTTGGKLADLEGHDVAVVTHEVKTISTMHGESLAAKVTVYDATGEETHFETLWFGKVVVATCSRSIGKPIIARVEKGKSSRAGMSAPWVLSPIDDAKRKKAVIDFAETNGIADEISAVALRTGAEAPAVADNNDDDENPPF